jgi:hypothetical protein
MDRRIHPRLAADFNVAVTSLNPAESVCSGRVVDVSPSGLCALLPLELATGTLVKLEIADSALFGHIIYSNRESAAFRTGVAVERVLLGGTDLARLFERSLREALIAVPGLEPSEARLG